MLTVGRVKVKKTRFRVNYNWAGKLVAVIQISAVQEIAKLQRLEWIIFTGRVKEELYNLAVRERVDLFPHNLYK